MTTLKDIAPGVLFYFVDKDTANDAAPYMKVQIAGSMHLADGNVRYKLGFASMQTGHVWRLSKPDADDREVAVIGTLNDAIKA